VPGARRRAHHLGLGRQHDAVVEAQARRSLAQREHVVTEHERVEVRRQQELDRL
jgi:hypothetical protein